MVQGKVVLTGGTGLIMSNVAERYALNGNEVVIFDNQQQHGMCEETLKLITENANVRFIEGDIRELKAVAEVTK
ncbi:MAG: NAD-dependent epimerase/dehydratase family protein, partial [Deltaproteobacteria bacterium]|nr:NAD-dependent epimerase/dehydratase family protein [Deltaproteobacteria bacterium]